MTERYTLRPPGPANAGRAGRRDGLEGIVRRARLAILWEGLWPPLAGFLAVAALFLALSFLGLWLVVPSVARAAALVVLAAAALYFLWRLARVRPPSRADGVHRVEQASGTVHRPLTAFEDTLAAGETDPAARALWAAHRARMATMLAGMRAGWPAPALFRRDPWALRAVVGLLLFVGVFAASGDYLRRIEAAFAPLVAPVPVPPMRLDAWVTPPPYTGRAPVFLTGEGRIDSGGALRVPTGSTVVVRLHGAPEVAVERRSNGGRTVVEAETATKTAVAPEATPPAGDAAAREFRIVLDGDTEVAVGRGGEEAPLAAWRFAVDPDAAPTIAWAGPPTVAASGAVELAYTVSDDYGITEAEAIVVPVAGPAAAGAEPLIAAPEVPLVLPAHRARSGSAKTLQDLTAHPWAGARVRLTLVARDEAGQEGRSETIDMTLPERSFRKLLARAIVEQRRNLAIDAAAQPTVLDALDALTLAPDGLFDSPAAYVGTRMAYRRLAAANDREALVASVDDLWNLALAIEDGDLSLAARALRDAQEALRRALENGASEEEIAKLTDDLRKAMERYLSSLAEEMRRNPQSARPMDPNTRMLRPQDLDKMLDRIEELARQGSRDAAQQLLSELQQMLENLQAGRPGQPQQGGEGQQDGGMLDELGRMIQEQQRLMDETYRLDRGEGGEPQPGEGGQQMTPDQLAEALRQLQEGQGSLADKLQQLLDQLGQGQQNSQQGGQPGGEGEQGQQGEGGEGQGGDGNALGQAGEAMGRARDALGRSETGEAVGRQGDALDALRRGAQSLAEQMMGDGQMGRGPGGQSPSAQNEDPLGRMRRTEGPDLGNSVRVPDEIDVQRARQILEELRRRLGEPLRPQIELDYLERLLPRN